MSKKKIRVIKFRGQHLDSEEWSEGYYYSDGNNSYIAYEGEKDCIIHKVKPKTVGEYVECLNAFEGDVLGGSEYNDDRMCNDIFYGLVRYNPDKSRIMVLSDDCDWYEVDDFDYNNIIGNIFDNPELKKRFLFSYYLKEDGNE